MARTNNRLTNQGLWLDAGLTSFNPTTLFVPGQLGMVFIQAEKAYQIVQVDAGSNTVVAGEAVAWIDLDDFIVTTDISDTQRNLPAGVAISGGAVSTYIVIQVDGLGVVKDDGGNAAAGTSLILSATDGTVGNVAAGTASTYTPLAIATAAASGAGGTIACKITAPHNSW